MGPIASQITILTIVYSIVYSDADQRKHSPGTGEFPAQMASNAENVSICDVIMGATVTPTQIVIMDHIYQQF